MQAAFGQLFHGCKTVGDSRGSRLHLFAQGVIGGGDREADSGNRITSYNVCYTKLLRTEGNKPLRIFHKALNSEGTSVKEIGLSDGIPLMVERMMSICCFKVFGSEALVSTRIALAPSDKSFK